MTIRNARAVGPKPVRTGCIGPETTRKTAFLHHTFRATALLMTSALSSLPCPDLAAQAVLFCSLDTVTSVTPEAALAAEPVRIARGTAA